MSAETMWLRLCAPFAAFRPLAAGVFRGSSRTIPHSTAYGLVLNLASIELRASLDQPVTQKRAGVPPMLVAIGEFAAPEVAMLYQQLHGYPVGNSSKEFAEKTHGAKYHIAPARRELLLGIDVLVGVRIEKEFASVLDRVRKGLAGELEQPRYGLPFAGDNNFLFDRIDELPAPAPVRWYTPVRPGDVARAGTVRLTTQIDRSDSSKTKAALFAPIEEPTESVPDEAWVSTS